MPDNKVKPKIGKHIRPEFRRLLRAYRKNIHLASLLGITVYNLGMMKKRGYMSKKQAYRAEVLTNFKFQAKLLARKGAIKGEIKANGQENGDKL